ncbi:hypothetical protein C8Q78DRAFT_1025525 [Trametes maxima]|nr:hypothetical protein C8Q78DRAFT_1025525 [Trametes maxima]
MEADSKCMHWRGPKEYLWFRIRRDSRRARGHFCRTNKSDPVQCQTALLVPFRCLGF